MKTALTQLINQARVSGPGPIWTTDGGRECPIGWDDCSQAVFVDQYGNYDYGELQSGPGYQSCETGCSHKLQLPEWSEDEIGDLLWTWLTRRRQ